MRSMDILMLPAAKIDVAYPARDRSVKAVITCR
jgi:hypothetical protein